MLLSVAPKVRDEVPLGQFSTMLADELQYASLGARQREYDPAGTRVHGDALVGE